jgi:ketosteroid isomerase-like protein
MKNLLLVGLAIVLFTACDQKDTRYTQQSPEIDIIKKVIDGYNTQQYDLSFFADTAKTFFNTKTDAIELKDIVAYHQRNDVNYSERRFLEKDQEYEMVVTDKGHSWVNAWLDWRGTLKENGKVIDMPVHLTYRFVDGKIVTTYGYWDPTEIVLELQEIERKAAIQAANSQE